MDEDEIDEREMLKKKIKLLQQEIVERTRNYMQSSRHIKKSISCTPMVQKQVQTDDYLERYSRGAVSDDGDDAEIDLKQLQDEFDGIINGFQQITNNGVSEQSKNKKNYFRSQDESQWQIYTKLLKLNRDLITDLLNSLINSLTSPNSSFVLTSATLLQQLQKIRQQYLPFYSSLSIQAFKLFESQRKQYDTALKNCKQFQVRCQFITKALNQSQETNYQLRLKNQQFQSRLRKSQQNIIKSQKAISENQQYETKIQQLKLKVEQLQVMKKQYLRAYSKIKQQKQQIELKLLDLSDELENMHKLHANKNGQWQHDFEVEEESHEQTRLKTIIQHSEDELIEGVMRQTGQNSLSAIRQIIEHGLMETNRSTSQKWIKSALIKIEEFEHSHEEQLEKVVLNQSQMESSIHQKYKTLLSNIKRHTINEKKQLQQQFNKTLSRIIGYHAQQLEKNSSTIDNQIRMPFVKKPSFTNKTDSIQRDMSSNDEVRQFEQQSESTMLKQRNQLIQILNKKLEQSNHLLAEHKIKYETLLSSKTNASQSKIANQTKLLLDFRKFMSKLINTQSITHNEKFTQQLFDRLAHKIFETLCNLPIGDHGQVFFVPTNQQQLQDAVEVIYNFSLQFDKLQQNRIKQFKNQAISLTKMLEQIVVANDVPAEMVIQSMHHNLDEQNTLSGGYVKSLIKKLSAEQNQQKSKQMQSLPKQQQTINSYQSVKSDD